MTFEPVVPLAILIVIATAAVVLRLLTMWQLAARGGHRWSTVWRWSGLTLAVVLTVIAAARPGIGHGERDTAVQAEAATNVFFVVDRSADSGIADYGDGGPRVAGIRDDIASLIDHYPGANFALVSFAARPSLDWPLSADAWSLQPVVAGISTQTGAAGDVDAAAAANVLRYQLIAADQRSPGAQNLVFYFGSGAPGSRAPQGDFEPRSVDGGAVFGYGEASNETGLRRVAQQLGVPYVDRDSGSPVTDATPEAGGDPAVVAAAGPGRTELYWGFTLVAAVLLLFEIFLSLREFRASRSARRDVVT